MPAGTLRRRWRRVRRKSRLPIRRWRTLIASNRSRLPNLIPLGYGRMTASPFTFYRGAAAIMAGEPLFLQFKEAHDSVLEPYAGRSAFKHRAERVVVGQRIVRAASDVFLGWATREDGRHMDLRQLSEVKIKPGSNS